jgi:hypothetical protein
MNESRPWWKLSWPAVVAGLVMLGAVAWQNLVGEMGDMFHTWDPQLTMYGWPWKCVMTEKVSDIAWIPDSDGIVTAKTVVGPTTTKITSAGGVAVNALCAMLLMVGAICTLERWHRGAVIRFSITTRGLLAITSCAAIFLASARAEWLPSLILLILQVATGVVFVGIFLTCFAVIDWIDGLSSLATRRLFARSTSTD